MKLSEAKKTDTNNPTETEKWQQNADDFLSTMEFLTEGFLSEDIIFSGEAVEEFTSAFHEMLISFLHGGVDIGLFTGFCLKIVDGGMNSDLTTPVLFYDLIDYIMKTGKRENYAKVFKEIRRIAAHSSAQFSDLDETSQKKLVFKSLEKYNSILSPKMIQALKEDADRPIQLQKEEIKKEILGSIRSDQYAVDCLAKIGQSYEQLNTIGIFLLTFLLQKDRKPFAKYKRAFLKGKKLAAHEVYKNDQYHSSPEKPLLREMLLKLYPEDSPTLQIFDWIYSTTGVRGLRNIYSHSLNDPTRVRLSKEQIEINWSGKAPFESHREIFDLKTLTRYTAELNRLSLALFFGIGVYIFSIILKEEGLTFGD